MLTLDIMVKLNKTYLMIVLFCTILIVGCNNNSREISSNDFKQFVLGKGSDFIINREINGIRYSVCLLPQELVLLNQGKLNNGVEFYSELKGMKKFVNFNVTIGDFADGTNVKNLILNRKEFMSKYEYLNSSLIKDFVLEIGDKKINCSSFHFETPDNIRPELRIALGFELDNPINSDFTLIYDDEIFQNGKLKYNFSNDLLTDLPKINFL